MARILLVEDDKLISEFAKGLLIRNGHQVFPAYDGQEAMTMVERYQPQLIILDIIMPRMDGFQLLATLRKDWRMKNIPVIMLSGRNELNDILRCKKEGVKDYILKPFKPDDFITRVNRALTDTELSASNQSIADDSTASGSGIRPPSLVNKDQLSKAYMED